MNDTRNRAQQGENGHSPNTDTEAQQHVQAVCRILRKRRHPFAVSWMNAHPGLPAAVSHDGFNGQNTRKAANKLMPRLRALEAHAQALGHGLILVTVNSRNRNPADLYNGKGAKWAKATARAIAGDLPHYWNVEYGPDSGIHLHLVISAQATAAARANGARVRVIFNLWGMARYLSKPADSRAARLNRRRMPNVEAHADAVSAYLTARAARFREARAAGRMGRVTLPDMWGFVGLQCAIGASKKPTRETPSHTAENTPTQVAA